MATDTTKTYKISGQVLNSNAEPIMGQEILVADVDLLGAAIYKTATTVSQLQANAGFQFLSTAPITTDTNGYFEFSFPANAYANNEIGLADVIVFAVDQGNIIARSRLATAKDYTDKNEILHLDVQLPTAVKRGTSEYARLIAVINPFVQSNKLNLFQLSDSDDQVSFLSTETNQDLARVTLAVQAAKLANDSPQYKFPSELLYGIGRQNIALSWTSLLLKNEADLSAAIQNSIDQNIIAPQDGGLSKIFIGNLYKASLDHSATASETAVFYKTIGFTVKDATIQKAIVQSYMQFNDRPGDFWTDLSKKQGITPVIIRSLQLTNQLSLLTGQHTALIEHLQVTKAIKDPSDLINLSTDDWNKIIKITGVPDSVTGNSVEDKTAAYINGIQNLLHAAYPTQKIALMVSNNQLSLGNDNIKAALAKFFATAPEFDISSKRIQDFENIIKSVSGEMQDQVMQSLRLMQRIYQVSPTPEAMAKLINKGYTSAYHISSFSQNAFIKEEAESLGGANIAASIYNRARHQVMRVQLTMLKLRDTMDKATPSKIISGEQQTTINNYINSLK